MRVLLRFMLIAILLLAISSQSRDPLAVITEYYNTQAPNVEDPNYSELSEKYQALTDEYIDATGIRDHLNSLPWSVSNDMYRLVRLGSVGFRMVSLGLASEIENAQSMWDMASASTHMAATGDGGAMMATGIEMIVNNVQNMWEVVGLVQEMNEIFKSRPGSRLELMAVDYDTFARLYMGLGSLKVLGENWKRPENQQVFDKSLQLTMVAFVQSARQLAGMKKVSGGKVVALSIEARLALALMELPEELQHFVLNYWNEGAQAIIKKEASWFGNGRDIFKNEVADSLTELETLIDNPDLKKGIRTGTYSAKVGILTVGLAQMYFATPERALSEIANAEETLEKWGMEPAHLSTILTPLTYSSSLIKSGLELGVEWTLGPVAYMETLAGALAGGVISGVGSAYSFLAHPGQNLGLNWVAENSIASASQAMGMVKGLNPSGLVDACGSLFSEGLPNPFARFGKQK